MVGGGVWWGEGGEGGCGEGGWKCWDMFSENAVSIRSPGL